MRRGVFLVRDAKEAGSTMRAIFDGLMMQWLSEKDLDGHLRELPGALRAGDPALPARAAPTAARSTDERHRHPPCHPAMPKR